MEAERGDSGREKDLKSGADRRRVERQSPTSRPEMITCHVPAVGRKPTKRKRTEYAEIAYRTVELSAGTVLNFLTVHYKLQNIP